MSLFKALSRALLAASLITFAMPTAHAGSLAQTISPLTLRLGPGTKYPANSDLPAKIEVDVERCQNRWCLVTSQNQRGWASMDKMTFGEEPRGPFSGPKGDHVLQGSGTICFHTGENFSGQSTCSKTGMVVPDLALYGLDNAFMSVSITGAVSAHVCRDFNFASHCETIAKDTPVLSRFLRRAVSSYRVW